MALKVYELDETEAFQAEWLVTAYIQIKGMMISSCTLIAAIMR